MTKNAILRAAAVHGLRGEDAPVPGGELLSFMTRYYVMQGIWSSLQTCTRERGRQQLEHPFRVGRDRRPRIVGVEGPESLLYVERRKPVDRRPGEHQPRQASSV